jgi:peptide/nickel transport system ATP-binding protein
MQLVQRPSGQTVEGEIRFNDGETAYNVVNAPNDVMRTLRGNKMSMIFQEPMTSLNPVFRIGAQVDEVIALHNPSMSKADVKARTMEMLEMVGIANKEGVYAMYPHELSGGMRQRIMIAMALACDPKLIIADEPTTALDVTIQAQILDLLRNLKDKINSSIMLITHDLGVVAEMADYVVVMYAGRVVEKGTAREIFKDPRHPYTIGLMNSKPVVGKHVDRLYSIPGSVPNPVNMPDYCYFKDRCEMCVDGCEGAYPEQYYVSPTHMVSCYRCKEGGTKHV